MTIRSLFVIPAKAGIQGSGNEVAFQLAGLNITDVIDPLGQKSSYSYNSDGLIIGKTDPLGNFTAYEWDPITKQKTKTIGALNREWRYSWNGFGRPTSLTDPIGGSIRYCYDSKGACISKIDQQGQQTKFVFDENSIFLTKLIDAENGVSSFTYDARGNITSVSDPLGRITRFEFDDSDRLVKTISADGGFVSLEYDIADNQIVRRDHLGRETKFEYNINHQPVLITNPDGTTISFAYDGLGRKIAVVDPLGRETRFEYDPYAREEEPGRLTKIVYPDNSFELFEYDTAGQLVTSQDTLGNKTKFEYNPSGRLVATIDPTGARWESQYDAAGRKISDKDPLNRVTNYQLDLLDRITKVIRPDNSLVTNNFDASGNLLSTVDALGNQWRWNYDKLNRQVRAIQPNGASSTTVFDAAGQVIAEADALGRVTRFSFDNGGRIISATDALGNVWQNFYDNAGRLTTVKNPLGAASSMTYDIMDRIISETDPLGNVNLYEFDTVGRRIAKTDAMGRRSITAYDLRDHVINGVDPEGHTVSYGYNLAGQRVSLTDGANRTWRWEYDSLGRVISEIDPLGNINRYEIDSVGNRTSWTNARNQTTSYQVDLMNRLSQVNFPDGILATMTYDLEGRELSRSGAAGSVVKTWDSVGNMTSETFGPWGKKWQYSFDLAGNRIQAVDPEGQIFKYSVDKLNHLVNLNPPEKSDEIKFSFDSAGRLITEERSGVKTTNCFDLANRLLELKHERDHGKETIVASRKYQYNSVGNRISEQNEAGETSNYSFNGSDWLTKVQYPDGQQVSYDYNGAGDRISETTEMPTVRKVGRNAIVGTDTVVIPFEYDPAGRMISRASDTFVFDADGNQVSAAENSDETRYFWTPDNRLARVEKDIECQKHGKKRCHQCPKTFTVSESYGYEPQSWRRLTRKTDDQIFVSAFDHDDESHEYQLKYGRDDDDKDEKGKKGSDRVDKKPCLKLIRQFISGPGNDDLVATKYHGRTLEMLKDGLGSTIALTNRGRQVVSRMNYDAWGNLKFPDKPGYGVQPCKEEALDDIFDKLEGKYSLGESSHDGYHFGRHFAKVFAPYLYTSRRFDTFSNLYNSRNRLLNPRIGRFITKDPIGFNGGLNLFSYANNNPVNYTDPYGLLYVGEVVNLSGGISASLMAEMRSGFYAAFPPPQAVVAMVPAVAAPIIAKVVEVVAPIVTAVVTTIVAKPQPATKPPMKVAQETVIETATQNAVFYSALQLLNTQLLTAIGIGQATSKPNPMFSEANNSGGDSGQGGTSARDEASRRGSELVKKFKDEGVGTGAGRSGGHGDPYKRAGAELIRQANQLSKNDPLRDALKTVGNQLIEKGKSISHPGSR